MTIQPFSPDQWRAINKLGHRVDDDLRKMQVGLTMGGEPTYIAAKDQDSLQWRYTALGEDKRRIAGELLQHLQQRVAQSGSLCQYGLGKLYPGELTPRWAFGCFWRLDGEPLWRHPQLLASNSATPPKTWQDAKTFMVELLACLALPPDAIITAYDAAETRPKGFILPFLTVQHEGQINWQSCRWTGTEEKVTLLPGNESVGMRLPLSDLPKPEKFISEVQPSFDATPIRPIEPIPLAPDNSIQLALTVEVRQETVHIFMPPIGSARSYADVLTAIEATAEFLDCPVVIEGYAPPQNQGIQGFQITPDPGVLEVNIHPADNWPDLVQLHQTLDEAAIACGLTSQKYALDGRVLSTGGGAHITIGGSTPQQSPLLRRPDLLRSLITYWQHHPSLSYAFSGEYIGPTSQAPRVDESRHDSLYELELAFLTLARCESVEPAVMDRLLTPLLQDVTGNTHRTALCIDKLFPRHNPHLQLGLLEFRGFEMPPTTGLRLLQMLLIRACVAWFWHQPFTKPLKRWGAELRDRWLLPHYLEQDFEVVLADLRGAGYAFQTEWFAPFWKHRFPHYGQLSLDNPARMLEVQAALEPWPVIGEASSGGTTRPVDNSLERIQITLSGAVGDQPDLETLSGRYMVLCNGRRLPMRSAGIAGKYVGGVRFRARSVWPTDDFASPHVPLHFHVIDTWQHKFVGGATYHVQPPTGENYERSPVSAEEAQARIAERFVPIRQGTVPDKLPPLILHPEAPMTLDLRLVL